MPSSVLPKGSVNSALAGDSSPKPEPPSANMPQSGTLNHPNSETVGDMDYFSQVSPPGVTSAHTLHNQPELPTSALPDVHGRGSFVENARRELYGSSTVEKVIERGSRERFGSTSTRGGSSLWVPPDSSSRFADSTASKSRPSLPEYPNQSYAALQRQEYPPYHHAPYNSRSLSSTNTHYSTTSVPRNQNPTGPSSLQDRRTALPGNIKSPSLYTPLVQPSRSPYGHQGTDEPSPYPSPYLHPVQLQPPRTVTNAKKDVDVFSGRKMINHYEILDELGRGVHGKVKLARDLDSGDQVAIKIVQRLSKRKRLGKASNAENKVKKEVAILKKAQHPNVVRMIEVIDDPEVAQVYIVLEFCELKEIAWRTLGTTPIVILENRRLELESQGLPADDVTSEDDKTILAVTKRLEEAHIRPVHAHRAKSASHIWSLEYGGDSDSGTDDEYERTKHMTPRIGADSGANNASIASRLGKGPGASHDDDEMTPDQQLPAPVDATPRRRPSTSPNEQSAAVRESEFGSFTTDIQAGFSPQWPKWSLPNPESPDENRGRRKTSVAESLSSQLTEIMQEEIPEESRYVPTMTIAECRSAFRDALIGLDYLHYHGIIHRDIKPANLLRTREHRVKISDFGVSYLGKPIRDGIESADTSESESKDIEEETELAKTVGTPAFFAPELCSLDFTRDMPTVTGQIDVWALGATLYCLLFARTPFQGENEFMLMRKIAEDELFIPRMRLKAVDVRPVPRSPSFGPAFRTSDDRRLRDDFTHEYIDDELYDLLKKLFAKDPTKRITIKEIKHHPWILRDIPNPTSWPDETDPARYEQGRKIEISSKEVEDAVIPISFVKRMKSITDRGIRALGLSGKSSRGSKSRPQSSNHSSVATSVASSTRSLADAVRDDRKNTLRPDESIVAALKASRERDLAEHPLSRSVTASPDPGSSDDESEDSSHLTSTVQSPALDTHSPRPGMPDRQTSDMSTTASIKTIRPSDMERARQPSVTSIQEDTNMPGTQTVIEQPHGSAALSGIFGGGGRGLLRSIRSKERLSPVMQSPTHGFSSEQSPSTPYGGPSIAVSNTSVAGHVDIPAPLRENSSAGSPHSSPKTSRKSSLAEIWDATKFNAHNSLKMHSQSTDRLKVQNPSLEFHETFHDNALQYSDPRQLEFEHAMEGLARRRALEEERSREQANATRNASRNVSRPSTSSGQVDCPPSPDDEAFEKARQAHNQPYRGRFGLFHATQASTPSLPYNGYAISSTSSEDQLASGLSQSNSYPSLQSVISADTSLPEMEYMTQPKYDSSASSDGTISNHNTVAQQSLEAFNEAGDDPSDDDAYAVETDEDDDSSDGDEGLVLMSRRKSHNQAAKAVAGGATTQLSRRRQTTLRRRTSTRSGSAHTMRKIRSHSIGEIEKQM